jgi:putative intracellular protease/amidase
VRKKNRDAWKEVRKMKKTVYMYVFDTMADWETGFLTAELNSGRFFKKGLSPLKVKTFGRDQSSVTTMGGVRILPECTANECDIEEAAALILPGGLTWMEAFHDPVLEMASTWLREGVPMGAICGATIALAGKGLLNGRRHTSNDLAYLKQNCPNYTGESLYVQEPAATGGNLVTASGDAPVEFTAHMLKLLDVFSPAALDAWLGLYRAHDVKFFFELMGGQ